MEHFRLGIKHVIVPRLGVEVEHFIVHHDTKTAISYDGVRDILRGLMLYYPGAEALGEEDLLGFSTEQFAITLEPAAQLEISIIPLESIAHIADVYDGFYRNLRRELLPHGYEAIKTGCQPKSHVDDLSLIPKERYRLMDIYFEKIGSGGREMMRGTSSLQVSLDYFSEEDFRRKIQAAYYYSPILKILTDNSPVFEDRALTTFLKRTDIWRRVDKIRTGIVPEIFKPNFGFSDYAAFIGSIPPIYTQKEEAYHYTGDRTVSSLYENVSIDEKAMKHILSMAFPDVRLKKYLELRMADSVPTYFMLAYIALIKGLLYSEEGLAFAEDHIRRDSLSERDIFAAEDDLMTKGYDAIVYGQPLRQIAENIVRIAARQLTEEERHYLDPWREVICHGGIVNFCNGE